MNGDDKVHPWLPVLLYIAVYNDLDEVRLMSPETLQREAVAAADVVASGGDWLLRWEKPRGGKAGREEFHAVWKATVRALAIAAMQPGGTWFLGMHFDASRLPPVEQVKPVEPADAEMVEVVTSRLVELWDLSLRLGVSDVPA